MPRGVERRRGGVLRYRTLDVGRGKYIHVAVVRKAGKRGGHTVAGPVHRVKHHHSRKFSYIGALSNRSLGIKNNWYIKTPRIF